MKAIVAERGHVTIPKALRHKLGIKPGTTLDFYVHETKLVAVKLNQQDAVAKVYGCLRQNSNTDQIMIDLRGEV